MAGATEHLPLILASGSATRRAILTAAAIAVDVVPASGVDEGALRDTLLAGDSNIERTLISEALAAAKAEEVSRKHPRALVIGADQILTLGGEVFEKPRDIGEARACLIKMRGKQHELHASVALAKEGAVEWMHTSTARLVMRDFSDEALDTYIARAGTAVLSSVGAYQIEGPAIQLFDRIDGDYTTILGLPLLPLLAELRARKLLTT